MTVIVTGLSKSFGHAVVLDGLTFSVAPGEVVALLGPNGAGKTTTIGILTTLVAADAGFASVAGLDVALQPQQARRAVSVTGQSVAIDPMLTGIENVQMMARLHGDSPKAAAERARELLGKFGLDDAAHRKASTYSGGMRRRLDLALGLFTNAPVLILDEPTTGLDARSRAWVSGSGPRGGRARSGRAGNHAVPRGGGPACRPRRGDEPRRRNRRRHACST